MDKEKSMNKTITEIKDALVSISNSLRSLATDTKATYELRKSNFEIFSHLEDELNNLKNNPLGLKKRDS